MSDDQPDAEVSTWQNTQHSQPSQQTSFPQQDTNPQFQQVSGRRLMP